MLTKLRFWPSSRPIYKNIYRFSGPGFAVGYSAPGKWGPFEKYFPVTWNAPSFETKTKEAILYFLGHESKFQLSRCYTG
jgi:hypothetical protein